MTWSISFSAPSKDVAKLELTARLPAAMLSQRPHARDFDLVKTVLASAIDVCEEGTISVSASGHVDTDWDPVMPKITGVSLSGVRVSSVKATS